MPLEFRLAAECCRLAFDASRTNAVRSLAEKVDWIGFLGMAERHRINGLAWNALRSLDPAIPHQAQSKLSDRATAIAAQGLQAAVASASLSKELDKASIRHLFIKGLTVGSLAYASPFLKQSWDVDILVSDGQIQASAVLLQQLGYDLVFPAIDHGKLPRWHKTQKDSAWRHRSTGIVVELHSRLADNRRLIPTVGLNSPRQNVAVTPDIILPTLATEEMFAHLCVHGASSAWFRLKWISDLAAILSRLPGNVERLFHRSQQLGTGRSAGQALLLAHRLFEIELDHDLLLSLEADPSTRWLANVAMNQLLAPEPGDRPFGTAMIHASQLRLLPGLAFKAGEAKRQCAAALSNLVD